MSREEIPSPSERSPAQLRAERALTNALKRFRPEAEVINGRVTKIDNNLLPSFKLSQFESDFCSGAGGELEDKMRAPFSSSALVVNHFSPFKSHEPQLRINGLSDFQANTLRFEAKCPTGLKGTPPHLDVLITAPTHVLAIESKCTEHLGIKLAKFAQSYEKLQLNSCQSKTWLLEMMARGGRGQRSEARYSHAL
jgi:hypothetical protein